MLIWKIYIISGNYLISTDYYSYREAQWAIENNYIGSPTEDTLIIPQWIESPII
jgi:hypothetical protein